MTLTSPSPDADPAAPEPPAGRVVVGVDGSPGSLAALRWAVREAGIRKAELCLMLAWQSHPNWGGITSPVAGGIASGAGVGLMLPSDTIVQQDAPVATATMAGGHHETEVAAYNVLEASLASIAGPATADVLITQAAVEGHPANALLASVTASDLLVVGSRGHGEFARALLGSISQHVVNHAPCPVVVVPDPSRG